ncbi:hypothetical protein BKA69DRAFT_1046129 [Paraphysoderma sedebokerense]|nr:hypothetical protein BKA69DRAFT_1046129 [Paraphysoderma sedebokerense]
MYIATKFTRLPESAKLIRLHQSFTSCRNRPSRHSVATIQCRRNNTAAAVQSFSSSEPLSLTDFISSPLSTTTLTHLSRLLSSSSQSKQIKYKFNGDNGKPKREAAIVLPIIEDASTGKPGVLFTIRSQKLRNHRGEVSFPGGLQDSTDTSIEHTAIRELFEELPSLLTTLQNPFDSSSLSPSSSATNVQRFQNLGLLTPIPDKTFTIRVHPIVTYIGSVDVSKLEFNPDEVSGVFALPFSYLLDPTKRDFNRKEVERESQFKGAEKQVRRFGRYKLDNDVSLFGEIWNENQLKNGENKLERPEIWGLTFFVLNEFLSVAFGADYVRTA